MTLNPERHELSILYNPFNCLSPQLCPGDPVNGLSLTAIGLGRATATHLHRVRGGTQCIQHPETPMPIEHASSVPQSRVRRRPS